MYNLDLLRSNPEIVKKELKNRKIKLNFDQVLKLDQGRREITEKISQARQKANQLSKIHRKPEPSEIRAMKKIKSEIKNLEEKEKKIKKEFNQLIICLPNISHSSVPVGQNEKQSKIIKKWGRTKKFNFAPRAHWELAEKLNLVDFKQAAKLSGARFWYFKGDLVRLQIALINFIFDKLTQKDFTPILPPIIVQEKAMLGTGFFPAEKNQYYQIANPEEESTQQNLKPANLYLTGTSEVALAGLHMEQSLNYKNLPLKYAGYSACFRREAGTYGKDLQGFFRGHQFDKIEMFVFCQENESWQIHEELLKIDEEIYQELNLPYQIVNICAGELGQPNAKKYDLEAYFPYQKKYRELVSCSNDTDFQARRLNIKYKDKNNKKNFVHTLNSTAFSFGRPIACILENYQEKDGSVGIPACLEKWMGKKKIEQK